MSVSIDIKKDDLRCLELLAKGTGKNLNCIISEAIDEYLERILDKELLRIAEERAKDSSPTIPHEKVKEMYGL